MNQELLTLQFQEQLQTKLLPKLESIRYAKLCLESEIEYIASAIALVTAGHHGTAFKHSYTKTNPDNYFLFTNVAHWVRVDVVTRREKILAVMLPKPL